ncbi:purine-nucleoside phosphorylase [Spiroplasma poulsonii]|uniref:Uridine phosphorylase n=1 Tax=Spiroplasma poulsonii TaxID=2138 RepID=A0A433EPF7_9MOLU|nr:purine-nucleoside phosphorylase [Spiroplasma poulsonii]MBW3058551.1 purine-nucleoside phosphorylase [Spiroplasma poulsonii]RUP76243.1 purine-nucleoside phosphorylase [Spiroplasma poulsonii]
MTPHINAKPTDIAKVVLMPGDPLRAKAIAEKYLTDYKLVNEVRNMFMYTGKYQDIEITIAGSGMGCPSIGIYSYELFKFYDVDYIIRIGSAGSYKSEFELYDIFNVREAFGESNYAKIAANIDSHLIPASEKLFNTIEEVALKQGIKTHTGTAHAADVFYRYDKSLSFTKEHNLDVVEMESYALFANAIVTKKQAATLLTISDNLVTKQAVSAMERQNNFMVMVQLALTTEVQLMK